MRNAITDVPGVLVGHATRIGGGALTGTTAVLFPPGTRSTVDVRGGGPATRDTAALDARYGGRVVRGAVLTGGSAYGLAAADGAARELDEPVPAAALFDLGRGGEFGGYPTAELGAEAVRAAGTEVAQGNVGAGTGALNAALKGGIGTASADLGGGVVVGAVAALNAAGLAVDLATGLPFGAALGLAGEFPARGGDDLDRPLPAFEHPFNTVIGVIATNARLPALFALANAAQDGLALAVRPAHGLPDGDTVFAASTGTHDAPAEAVLTAARQVFARALVHGLLSAESVTTPWGHLTSYREHYPRTAAGYPTRRAF
ncbi:P1 family peptidase [Actinosynnema sp. NPDC047251]|uniref:Peptidase S58 n=1 Tax=Saccharothrix espanaensis (strain ATCC 51144 / DSM 44229 / JCM 9112 / NBRC 15066 / NRRL 15764) TaxID=1179773 RepID=K0JS71_SACES|nr:P1 family peptidase [Saccharothrix espanaensis]CCH30520.1 Peptidase S58 [Saccharothrix espanaensis DSM 44229]